MGYLLVIVCGCWICVFVLLNCLWVVLLIFFMFEKVNGVVRSKIKRVKNSVGYGGFKIMLVMYCMK